MTNKKYYTYGLLFCEMQLKLDKILRQRHEWFLSTGSQSATTATQGFDKCLTLCFVDKMSQSQERRGNSRVHGNFPKQKQN